MSKDTTDRLITGGIIAVIAGPLLAAVAFVTRGFDVALAAAVLSILPIALGIDSILTGARRRRARLAMSPQQLDYAP